MQLQRVIAEKKTVTKFVKDRWMDRQDADADSYKNESNNMAF